MLAKSQLSKEFKLLYNFLKLLSREHLFERSFYYEICSMLLSCIY
nr:MAG TPA: hypothetical protein [Caudoviricetes sp.]